MNHERREYLKANNMYFTLAVEDDGAALDGMGNCKAPDYSFWLNPVCVGVRKVLGLTNENI